MGKIKESKPFLRWFKLQEFACKEDPFSYREMEEGFIKRLDFAREISNCPFVIAKGYEIKNRDNMYSSHPKGVAVNIKVKNRQQRYNIIESLLKARFNRIGLKKDGSEIHVDFDEDLSSNQFWMF